MSIRAFLCTPLLLATSGAASAQSQCQILFDAFRFCPTFSEAIYQGEAPDTAFFVTQDGYLSFHRVADNGVPLEQVASDQVTAIAKGGELVDVQTLGDQGDGQTLSFRAYLDDGLPKPDHPTPGLVTAKRLHNDTLLVSLIKPNRDLSTGTVQTTPKGATIEPEVAARFFDLIDQVEPKP